MIRVVSTICFLAGLSILFYFAVDFYDYYSLPLIERPHSSLHQLAKPGGSVSHGLGVAGSTMVLLLFLYSLRRREIIRWGSLSRWLNVHIMLGILGPLYVTLHSAFKFGGIVSVSYFSMVAVMLSGIFGRYLYLQIPRAITGGELSDMEINARKEQLHSLLMNNFGLTDAVIKKLVAKMGEIGDKDRSAIYLLFTIFVNDMIRSLRFRSLRKTIRVNYSDHSQDEQDMLARRIKESALLSRRVDFLDTTQRIFYYWHVIHRPFAFVMIFIMFIHIGVVIYFGYRWIF